MHALNYALVAVTASCQKADSRQAACEDTVHRQNPSPLDAVPTWAHKHQIPDLHVRGTHGLSQVF
jgi:hypothetical protein